MLYRDTETKELKELLRTYFEKRHPQPTLKRKIAWYLMVLALVIMGGGIVNVLESGLSIINSSLILIGGTGVYFWHENDKAMKFYDLQIKEIQTELDSRGCS